MLFVVPCLSLSFVVVVCGLLSIVGCSLSYPAAFYLMFLLSDLFDNTCCC